MTYAPSDPGSGPTRRTTLAGLVGGAVLTAGCTRSGTAPANAPALAPSESAAGPTAGATPGVMTLFKDPAFNFNGLWALGASAFRAAEVGEVLTAVNAINKAGLSAQT
ncbi:hypothetical protein [Streptomyces sp. NPDC056527]|uniref:hypothetical protein n=1 Tax=Streptomyces sp. NPDC056527 TaxID=3345853 RepID=UPI0036CE6D4F